MSRTKLARVALLLATGVLCCAESSLAGAASSIARVLKPRPGSAAPAVSDEEFVGPFASWRNLKVHYGATGDGVSDDTAALQAALDDMKDIRAIEYCVLYVPAGTYRITSTVTTTRSAHWDFLGLSIVGEDPATTVIVWDGQPGQSMLSLDFWYGKVSRLTLDGGGTAATGLYRLGMFSTACEVSDMVFKDMETGVQFGGVGYGGQAEHAVLRCTFSRCSSAGIVTIDFNSLDIWLWYCRFEDCRRGAWNIMGNFHVYSCVFERSTEADIASTNLSTFAFVDNTSIGSRMFFDFNGLHSWGAPTLVQGNRIYDTTYWAEDYTSLSDVAMSMVTGTGGPFLLLDNLIRSAAGRKGPAVLLAARDNVLVGNTYTVKPPELSAPFWDPKRIRSLDARYVDRASVPDPKVELPGTPPNRHRTIFEVVVGTGNDTREIQARIDAAAREPFGSRPVVHIPKGLFGITETIVVPALKDIQIVGDGLSQIGGGVSGTYLRWDGAGSGPMLKLEGPSRVVLRDMSVHGRGAGEADGILVTNCDQPGGRIYASQLLTGPHNSSDSPEYGVLVNGVENSDVTLVHASFGGATKGGILVKGGPVLAAGGRTDAQTSVLTGTAAGPFNQLFSVSDGGRLVAKELWIENSDPATHVYDAEARGAVTLVGLMHIVTAGLTTPSWLIDGMNGSFTLAASSLGMYVHGEPPAEWFKLTGDGSLSKVLNLGNIFWLDRRQPDGGDVDAGYVWRDSTSPDAQAAMLNCNINADSSLVPTGFTFLDDVVDKVPNAAPSDQLVRDGLEQLRSVRIEPPVPRRPGATDVKLFRVWITGGKDRHAALELAAEIDASAPVSPANLAAVALSPTETELSWADRSRDETGFEIERKTGRAGAYSLIGKAGANRTWLRDGKVAPNTTYSYRMWATNAHGVSGYSNVATVTTPGAPEGPTELTTRVPSRTQIVLEWADNSANEAGFRIERRPAAGGSFAQIALAPADATSYSDPDLPPSAAFAYRVRATNPRGDSRYSNEATATTALPGDVVIADAIVGNLHYVRGGTFLQGSPAGEPCQLGHEYPFTHTLTRNFAVMETEVTRQMWADLSAGQSSLPPDPTLIELGGGMTYPIQNVTWYEAVLFANLLSLQEGLTRCYFTDATKSTPVGASNYISNSIYCDFQADGYRLPTEGECEYLTRAGTTTPFSIVEPSYTAASCDQTPTVGMFPALDTVAWYVWPNTGECTHPVGTKAPNPWGLHDVHGNVREWCWDWFQYNYPVGQHRTDWAGPTTDRGDGRKAVRGGSCADVAEHLRSAYRADAQHPDDRWMDRGFRLVRAVP